jgi:flagellar hook-basal body complex protein FliE
MRIDNAITNPKLIDRVSIQKSEDGGQDFGKTLMDAIKEVNASQSESREMQGALMAGQPVDVDDVMIAMERASISMQLTMQVRNKVLEAYQEISRMQV